MTVYLFAEGTFEQAKVSMGLPRLLLTRVLGRCERGPVDCFIFDGREFSQPSLPSPAVVGPLDPGCDGQSEVLSGEPPLTVQNVLLQQREERFHCGVVSARTDPAHRAGEPVVTERFNEPAGPELGPSDALLSVKQQSGVVLCWGDVLAAGVEDEVDLAGEVSLQATDDFHLGVSLGGLFRHVSLRSWVEPDPADDREVQGAVGLPVAAAIESVPLCHSRRRWQG